MLAFLKRLTRRRPTPTSPPPMRVRPTFERDVFPLSGSEIEAAWLSDAGCVRERNEDRALFVNPLRAEPPDAALHRAKGCLMLVADGLGGHVAGERASRLAVETISRVYFADAGEVFESLQAAFAAANSAIYEAARRDPELSGMGTTCTALVLRDAQAYIAQIGDSRAYLLRDDAIYLLSEDHSAVMEMVRRGVMTEAQARTHADKNIILRALGTRPQVAPTVWEKSFPVRAGDQFVLCSDGLYDLLTDDEIKAAVRTAAAPEACRKLMDTAKARGGPDNITVAVLRP